MRVLITGASGFIGTHLTRAFQARGHEVRGLVREKTDCNNSGCISACDLSAEIRLDWIPEAIIHAAARSPGTGIGLEHYVRDNIYATQNIVHFAEKHNVQKLIFFGAVSSFGSVQGVLQENSPHIEPNDYGLTKLVSERMVRTSPVPNRILILPGVVGAGCRGNWLWNTAKKLWRGEDVEVYNAKGLFNNTLLVEDLCRFTCNLAEQETEGTDTYILSNTELDSVEHVIKYIQERVHSASNITFIPHTSGGFYINSQKAQAAGFYSHPLHEILDEVCFETRMCI